LGQLPDRGYAGRLRRVYLVAAQAIHRLADIDLAQYETSVTEGAPDLSLWEEMAPVIRDTVVDVNALLMMIREQFPSHHQSHSGPTAIAEAALRSSLATLAQEITRLGEHMRSPEVVSDRWNLIADLQSFRTKFRDEIGNLVHQTASAFGEAPRKEVVPFYRLELDSALTLRATVADLVRLTSARILKVREAEPEDVQWNAQQFEKELDLFGRTPAYRALRAQDKRIVIELRHALTKVSALAMPLKKDLSALIEPFADFLARLSQVNKRETIMLHDREASAGCAVLLEQAQQLISFDPSAAAVLFGRAVHAAQPLYGRDPGLDLFLRKLRKAPVNQVNELQTALESLVGLLSGLLIY
jgi:hypothetical protein